MNDQQANSNIVFHTGALFVSGASGQPRRIMTMQETSFDFKGDSKKLMGENQFAIDTATGTVDITGKAKSGQLDPEVVNELFLGQKKSAGATLLEEGEQGVVTDGKYVVKAGVKFQENLGVRDGATLRYLTLVTGEPEAGQYAVQPLTGTYVFHSGQDDKTVIVDYLATDSTGEKIIVSNQLAGATVNFRGIFSKQYRDGRKMTMICPRCTCDSTQFGFKQNDYSMPDFSFSLSADGRGVPFEWHWSTVPKVAGA